MKIVTILGSPHRAGNTAAALAEFERGAGAAHAIERVHLGEMTLNGCLGCDGCQDQAETPGCVQEDDLAGVIERIQAADLVVYASPVYCWGVTAQMKALFDRLYCMVKFNFPGSPALLQGRAAMLLMTCGDDAGGNADLPAQAFRREMKYLKARDLGAYVIDHAQTPRQVAARAQPVAQEMWRLVVAAGPAEEGFATEASGFDRR